MTPGSVGGMGGGKNPKAHGPVNLTHTMRNHNETLSHKVEDKETGSQDDPLISHMGIILVTFLLL